MFIVIGFIRATNQCPHLRRVPKVSSSTPGAFVTPKVLTPCGSSNQTKGIQEAFFDYTIGAIQSEICS